jgi:TonB family protein
LLRIRGARTFAIVSVLLACAANRAYPQVIVPAGGTSSCPSVRVEYVSRANSSLGMTDAIDLGDGAVLTFGVGSHGSEFGPDAIATIYVSRNSSVSTDSLADSLLLVIDDSTTLDLDAARSTEVHDGRRSEVITAEIPLVYFRRASNAKAIGGRIVWKTFTLLPSQIGALKLLVAQMALPVTDRVISRNCEGGDGSGNEVTERTSPRTEPQVYFGFQVTKLAHVANLVVPEYPKGLQQSGIEGRVMAQFVVLENGTADVHTFKALESTDRLFTDAVRRVLPRLHFTPAEMNGIKVRQLVQLPFEFKFRPMRPSWDKQ